MSRAKKIAFASISVLLGLSVAILACEAGLRMATPEWLALRMTEAGLGNAEGFGSDVGWSIETIHGHFVRFRPNTSFHIKYYEYSTVAHIDQWGGRLIPSESGRKKGGPKVPFLGDSFGFGIGVSDRE